MTFIRSLLYAIWFYVTMAVIGLVCMPVSLFSRDAAMSAIRLWSGAQRLGLRVFCGIRTEFRGMEHLPKGAGLIAMKHQSTYDTIAPFLFIQNPGYILKKELLKIPVFGIYASRVGIPIDRAGIDRPQPNVRAGQMQIVKSARQPQRQRIFQRPPRPVCLSRCRFLMSWRTP